MAKITEIGSSSQLDSLLRANKYVIADFYATWCGPCKQIAPIFEQLATSHSSPGRLAFVKVDTDKNGDIAQQHNVSACVYLVSMDEMLANQSSQNANVPSLQEWYSQSNNSRR